MGRPLTMSQERLADYRAQTSADNDRFRVNLPWPLIRFETRRRTYTRKSGETVTVEDNRTYRFFSSVEVVRHTDDRTGFSWSDIQYSSPYWSSLMVLGLFSGLAPVAGPMPMGLYMVPVDDFPDSDPDPLAWAVNPPSSPAQKRAARMDAVRGMRPQLMFWASALVEEPDDKGGVESYIAVVQMKKNQAVKLADKWNAYVSMARVKGKDAQLEGVPVHAWEVRGDPKNYDLDLRRADGERIDLIKDYEPPDHDLLADGIRMELDRFLTEQGAPIKGFPNKGDHEDDGWATDYPACMQTAKPYPPKNKPTGDGLEEFQAPDYTRMSSRDLREELEHKGINAPLNASRERLLSMLEDSETSTE